MGITAAIVASTVSLGGSMVMQNQARQAAKGAFSNNTPPARPAPTPPRQADGAERRRIRGAASTARRDVRTSASGLSAPPTTSHKTLLGH